MNGDIEELSRITAEQHREFMAALAVLSDEELAYRLQLIEAMAASIASKPTPTISTNDSDVNLQTLNLQKLLKTASSFNPKRSVPALELKRIVVFCDYYPLYQFVNGRWPPKQQKTRDILHHVNLLQKSFTYSISYRISQEQLDNCVICLDDKSIDQFLSAEGCTHRYCYCCVKQHVEVKLLNGLLPKCPHGGCKSELKIESCEKFLTPKFTEMMRQLLKEDSIPVAEKVYCPYPKCSVGPGFQSQTYKTKHIQFGD
ncbi:putative transcription factor C2H2 family [Helianthus anomalus]